MLYKGDIMGIFDTKIQEEPKKKGRKFTDTDRMLAKAKRDEIKEFQNRLKAKNEELIMLQFELKRRRMLKQIREVDDPLDESRYEDEEEEPEQEDNSQMDMNNPESLMTGLLTKALLSHQKQKDVSQSPQQKSIEPSVSDGDIQQMVNSLPVDLIKKSQLVTDEQLSSIIMQKVPNLTPDQVKYAISLIRARV